MTDFDPVEFGRSVGETIRAALSPLQKRIEELESRQPEKGERGLDGRDGVSVTVADVTPLIDQMVKEAVATIPVPKDGKDGRDGTDGKDAEPLNGEEIVKEVVSRLLVSDGLETLADLKAAEAVSKHFEANPVRHGKDGEKGQPGERGEKGEAGKDGAGVADLLIDREGSLVATMTDGRVKSLGVVLGRDGEPGRDGKDGADFSKAELDWDGERTLVIRGDGGEIRKTISVPMDKGYYREGMSCEKADVVTHDGNAWIALRDTKAKPCHENKEDWRLFARKGRDGRDGKDGKPPPGPVRLTND